MKRNIEASQSPQDLLTDLRALVSEAEKMIGDSANGHSEEDISSWRDRITAAQERLGEVYTTTKRKVVAGAKYTDEAIRENPYQSIAIAAGVGLLAGILIGRRSGK